MATPVKPLPSSNRILAKGWEEAQHAAHQARLAKMRAQVDSTPPVSTKVKVSRAKQRSTEEANHERIDRENRILLQRMSLIHSRPSPALPPVTAPTPAAALAASKARSLNSAVRAREQERIAEENLALVARLKRGRGNQEALQLERHEREYEALRQAAQRTRQPPPPLPAPKFGATAPLSPSQQYADRFSELSLRPGERLLKSASHTQLRHGKARSMGSSASLSSLPEETRPVEETQDARGAVEPISAASYPSFSPRSAAASSQHTVTVAQDTGARIDGRSVMVSLDEMNSGSAEEAAAAGVRSTDPSLLHCFLFRTFESSSQSHDYVTVPYDIIAGLPECTRDNGALMDASNRDELAQQLFSRLRFHKGKLAFNPSHALKLKRSQSGARLSTAESGGRSKLGTPPSASSTKGKVTRVAVTPSGSPAPPASSTWDQIGPDGKIHAAAPAASSSAAATAEDAEWDKAVAGGKRDGSSTANSKVGGGGPNPSSPSKRSAAVGNHHLSTTMATILRAGQGAPDALDTIKVARENRARKEAFAKHVHPTAGEGGRSRSPSPKRPAGYLPPKRAAPIVAGVKDKGGDKKSACAAAAPAASAPTKDAPAAAPAATSSPAADAVTASQEQKEQS